MKRIVAVAAAAALCACEAFAAEAVELQSLVELKPSGIRAQAVVAKVQKRRIVCDLFGSGIVMVDLGPSAFGFAVRR